MHTFTAVATGIVKVVGAALFRAAAALAPCLVAVAAAAQDAAPRLPPSSAAVRGVVLDPDTRPVAGARAVLTLGGSRRVSATDAEGRFAFRAPGTGEGRLSIFAAGFPPVVLTVGVGDTDVEIPAVVLARPSFSDEVVVTAAGVEQRLAETPASLVALSAQSLWAAGATSVDAALRQVPGFALFRRTGSRTANPTSQGVSLRGVGASGASRALVLDDGVPLNDPFGGWVYWARVPRAAVGRVEMLRGGGSDVYGSGALGGVVQLFRPGGPPAALLEASYGSQSTPDASLAGHARRGEWSLSSSAEAFRTGGYVAVAEDERGPIDAPVASSHVTLDAAVGHEASSGRRAFLRGAYFEESRDNGTPFQRNDTRLRQLAAGADGRSGGHAFSLRAHAFDSAFSQTFSAVAGDRASEQPTRAQRVPSSSQGVAGRWSHGGDGGPLWTAGGEWSRVVGETDEIVLSAPGQPREAAGGRQWRAALFAGSALGLGERVRLTGGARLDAWRNHHGFRTAKGVTTALAGRSETAVSPRVALLVRASDRVSLAASAYRAFRAPTLNELYRSFRVGNVFTTANEELQAERMNGFEAGALLSLTDRARLRGNLFWMDLDRTVANVTLSVEPNLITRQRQNLGRARSRGVEVDAEARMGMAWSVAFGYLLADATVRRFPADPSLEGLRLTQVPRHSASLQLRYAGGTLSAGAQVRWAGDQFDDDQNRLALRGYWSVDAEARRALGHGLEAFVGGENLTGSRYDVGRTPVRTVGPPRSLRAGLRLRLSRAGRAGASAPLAPPPRTAGSRALRPEPNEDGMTEQAFLGALAVADLADHARLDPGVVAAARGLGAGGLVAAEAR